MADFLAVFGVSRDLTIDDLTAVTGKGPVTLAAKRPRHLHSALYSTKQLFWDIAKKIFGNLPKITEKIDRKK